MFISKYIRRRGYTPISPIVAGTSFLPYPLLFNDNMGANEETEPQLAPATQTTKKPLELLSEGEFLARRGVARPNAQALQQRQAERRTKTLSAAAGQALGMLIGALTGGDPRATIERAMPAVGGLQTLLALDRDYSARENEDYKTQLAAFYDALNQLDKLNQEREIANLRWGDENQQDEWVSQGITEIVDPATKKPTRLSVLFNKRTGQRKYEPFGEAVQPERQQSDLDAYRFASLADKAEVEGLKQLDRVRENHARLQQALAKINDVADDRTKRAALISLMPELAQSIPESATSDEMRSALIDALAENEKRGRQWQEYLQRYDRGRVEGFDYYSKNREKIKQIGGLEVQRKKLKQELDRLVGLGKTSWSEELQKQINDARAKHDAVVAEILKLNSDPFNLRDDDDDDPLGIR